MNKKIAYRIGYTIGYLLPYAIITMLIIAFIKIGVWFLYL